MVAPPAGRCGEADQRGAADGEGVVVENRAMVVLLSWSTFRIGLAPLRSRRRERRFNRRLEHAGFLGGSLRLCGRPISVYLLQSRNVFSKRQVELRHHPHPESRPPAGDRDRRGDGGPRRRRGRFSPSGCRSRPVAAASRSWGSRRWPSPGPSRLAEGGDDLAGDLPGGGEAHAAVVAAGADAESDPLLRRLAGEPGGGEGSGAIVPASSGPGKRKATFWSAVRARNPSARLAATAGEEAQGLVVSSSPAKTGASTSARGVRESGQTFLHGDRPAPVRRDSRLRLGCQQVGGRSLPRVSRSTCLRRFPLGACACKTRITASSSGRICALRHLFGVAEAGCGSRPRPPASQTS